MNFNLPGHGGGGWSQGGGGGLSKGNETEYLK